MIPPLRVLECWFRASSHSWWMMSVSLGASSVAAVVLTSFSTSSAAVLRRSYALSVSARYSDVSIGAAATAEVGSKREMTVRSSQCRPSVRSCASSPRASRPAALLPVAPLQPPLPCPAGARLAPGPRPPTTLRSRAA